MPHSSVLRNVLLLLFACLASWAQSITGTVTGSVTDASGGGIGNATATLRSNSTADTRTAKTNENGDFVFNAVIPGTYSLTVEQSGFKTLERTGLVLTATQRLAVRQRAHHR